MNKLYPTASSKPVTVTEEFLLASDTLTRDDGKKSIPIKDVHHSFGEQLTGTLKDINWRLNKIEASNMMLSEPFGYERKKDDSGNDLAIPFEDYNKTIQKFTTEYISDVKFEGDLTLSAIQTVHYKPNRTMVAYALGANVTRCSNGMIWGQFLKRTSSNDIDLANIQVFLRDWVTNHQKLIDGMTHFKRKNDGIYLKASEINEFIGSMFEKVVAKPSQMLDISEMTEAVRGFSDEKNLWPRDEEGGMTKWSLYNNFTETLKRSEINSRLNKHSNLYEYFV